MSMRLKDKIKYWVTIFVVAIWGVGRGLETILSHIPLTRLNMSRYQAIWTHIKPNSMTFNKYKSWNSCIWTSRFPENWSLFVGKSFFPKLCTSGNYVKRYRQNMLGPNFEKHLSFQIEDLWVLDPWSWFNLRFWYEDLGTKILVPRSLGNLSQMPAAEELNLWKILNLVWNGSIWLAMSSY